MTNYIACLMIMASILYGLLLSPTWVLLFPAGLAVMAIGHYFKAH